MFYKTSPDSATGKMLISMNESMNSATDSAIELTEELGGCGSMVGHWCVSGGISTILFDKDRIPENWKSVRDGFMPKNNNKIGKAIHRKISMLPVVSFSDLNACVGLKSGFGHIGYRIHDNNILYTVGEKLLIQSNYDKPDDCTEITRTEFNQLFLSDQ